MSRSQMKYHSKIGYTYMPSAKLRVPGAGGGYLVRTNAAGFRSDREFVREREPGRFRALLFGDSQTSGDGGPNASRYADLLENALPGLEIYNYSLSGSGPDQQFLVYQECADVEHDLLIVALYVENIRRVTRSVVKSRDSSGEEAYYPKPFYVVRDDGELALCNVPVPKRPWTEETLPEEMRSQIYSYQETNFFSRDDRPVLRKLASFVPMRKTIKQLAMRVSKFQPLPDYDDPRSPEWLLLRAILEAWFRASKTPVLLVTIPHYLYFLASCEPPGYQARFRELAYSTGCHVYDPLSDLSTFSDKERRSFWSEASGHLSAEGHRALAGLLCPVLERFVQAGTAASAWHSAAGSISV